MNVNEASTLTKMAIICTLVTLVIGASMSVWYLMWDNTSELESKWIAAANSASAEKLYQLQEQSESADNLFGNTPGGTLTNKQNKEINDAHPLVTTVANTLSEFDENSLLYIYIVERNSNSPTTSGEHLYTYTGYNITDHGNGDVPAGWNSKKVFKSENPITEAVKDLLTYSQYRCHLHIQEVKNSGNSYIGIIVETLTD